MLSEFVSAYIRIHSQHLEKSSMSFKLNLLQLPCLKLGNSRKYRYTLTSFVRHHAPCACFCSEKCQSLLFSTHLFGKGASQIKVHCHPPRSTPRFARRFTAPNDSHHYSTRFLRLGERAPNKENCKDLQEKRKPRRS